MTRVWDVPVHDSTRVRDVRVAAEAASAYAGLDDKRTHAASLVATELATNLLKHAGGGQVLVETVNPRSAGRYCAPGVLPSVQILTVDHGPGIRDIAAALGDGYSTTGSLGAGLGTCRRIADQFDLYSTPGRGTLALARITTSRAPGVAPEPEGLPARAGGLHVSLSAAEHSGDAWACAVTGSRMTLMVADGLGHGPEAARASDAAVDQLHRHPGLPPGTLLGLMSDALRRTRGAAVAIAQLDIEAGQLDYAGIGNIGARLRGDGEWHHLLSRPGIVGAVRPATLIHQRRPWRSDGLLVMHSDGLPSRWQPPGDPGLDRHDPAIVAATVLRDASSPARPVRDDTAVAVLTATR